MISLRACPRCNGAVLENPPSVDNALCINCGWRRADVPPDIQEQVETHLGEAFIEERYIRRLIGTGKPPLSGWQRLKRLMQRKSAAVNQ